MAAASSEDLFMRRVLWFAAVFNLGGAALFAFPAGPLGQLIELPPSVPGIYRALLAFFVLLFGGVYAWLAVQPVIHRALVGLSVLGKSGVFTIVVLFWAAGEGSLRGVLAAAGDLLFAFLFLTWLRATATKD